MSNPAQDEFNKLVDSQNSRRTQHPEDAASFTSNEDTRSSTLVPSTVNSPRKPSKNSLRSSAYNNCDSSGEDSDVENRIPRRKNTPYYIPNNHGYNENTGPKGVIADARAFERERRLGNKTTYVRTEGMVLPKMQHLQLGQEEHTTGGARHTNGSNSDLDEDDDLDDEFVRRWREKRGEEIKSGKWNGTYAMRRKGRYGTMKTMDAFGFLEALERTPRDTVVAIYVFDELVRIRYHSRTYGHRYWSKLTCACDSHQSAKATTHNSSGWQRDMQM